MPISRARRTRSSLDQSAYDGLYPPRWPTFLRELPAEALAIRADFSSLLPSRRSAWYCFSSLICALGMAQPYPVLSRQTSEFRGAERGQLLVQAAGPGRAEIARPGQSGPQHGEALALARRALARWQGQHGLQGRDRGVQRTRPQPRDGQVGMREHPAPAAVLLARAGAGGVQAGSEL